MTGNDIMKIKNDATNFIEFLKKMDEKQLHDMSIWLDGYKFCLKTLNKTA